MQQQWPMATMTVAPKLPPTAMTPRQQSLMPLPHWCDYDNEDSNYPLAIDSLIKVCKRLQQ